MNCMYCGVPLSGIDYCTGCGADITIQKRIIRISNLLYNEGLEKATVRDLSGAIDCLKRSLKFNKENIGARNLLGLVYFETGEVVSALSEWVISKNMNVPGNAADLYISKLQANKNKLDTINQTIRKYNQALLYCRQDNEDMAVIQLRKVLSQNTKLIKAYHLLALLYLKKQEYEKTRKLLKKAARIDNTNTTTLRYLQEVEAATGISTNLDVRNKRKYAKEKVNKLTGTMTYMSGNEMIIQPTTFRDSSAVATFINIFLGLVVGAAIVYFLIVPGTRQKIYEDANLQVTDANSKVAAEAARVQALEKEIEGYKTQIEEADKAVTEADSKAGSYDSLLKAIDFYLDDNQSGAAEALGGIDESTLTGIGKDVYDQVKEEISDYLYTNYYNTAELAYSVQNYADAIENYKKALEVKPDDYNAMYYLGFAYFNSNDKTNADKIFKEIIQKHPAEAAANNLSQYISNASSSGSTAGTTGSSESNPTGTDNGNTDNMQDDALSNTGDGTTGNEDMLNTPGQNQ